MRKNLESFGERLRRIREARGMSQGRLAKAISVTVGAISAVENGHSKTMKPEHVFAAADFLNVAPRELVLGMRANEGEDPVPEMDLHQAYLSLAPDRKIAVRTLVLALAEKNR